MARHLQYRRLLWLALLVVLAFCGLGYRLYDLQVLRHEELSDLAEQNSRREVLLQPRRGDILDVKGNVLATCVPVKNVCADPTLLGNRQAEVARALSPLLQMSEVTLAQMLQPKVRQNAQGQWVTNQYVCLKQKVPLETWEHVRQAMQTLSFGIDESKCTRSEQNFYRYLRQKAIFSRDDQLRFYPNKTLAAHVIGYTATEERKFGEIPVMQIKGLDGVEAVFNTDLSGTMGWRRTETNRKRQEMVTRREQDVQPRDGVNVVLTIDSVIQNIVESALAEGMEKYSPISISGLVVRPRTGEILALATLPNFDPNSPGSATADARRNRVICDIAEPGSTFKIVIVSGALNEGAVRLTDVFDCEHGRFHYGGRVLHDHESYGALSVQDIIMKSSNIGAAKIGIKLGENEVYNYIMAYGFGKKCGLPLPVEVSGIVHPVNKWSKVSIAQIPMGHGVAVTRLQMTMAMCAIANQGLLMRPVLVDRLEDREHHLIAKYGPQPVEQVIRPETAKQMVKALKTVVSKEGTAAKAALDHYDVAGKTGTAQKVEHGTYVEKFFSSFIGFFPADNPELCISITLDEPKPVHYGGQVAAPVFKQIAERAANYLNIPPKDPEPPVVAETAEWLPSDPRPVRTAKARSQ